MSRRVPVETVGDSAAVTGRTHLVDRRSSDRGFGELAGKRAIDPLADEVLELGLIVGRGIICSERQRERECVVIMVCPVASG